MFYRPIHGSSRVFPRCLVSARIALQTSAFVLAAVIAVAQSSSQVQGFIQQGQAALDAGRFAQAVTSFEQARQIAPESLPANRGLLLSYLQAGQLPQAVEIGRAGVARWPQDPDLQHYLGLTYFKMGDHAQALTFLRTSEKLNGSAFGIHFDIALVLLAQEQYGPAADELEHALRIDSSDTLAHVLLGRAYLNSNRTLQSIGQFETALRLDPKTPLGHYHLGFAYGSLGRNQEAIAEYQKQLVEAPDNARVLYDFGHCLLETGDSKTAVIHLQKATDLDPQNADAFYDLGKGLLLNGEVESAISALRRSIVLKPSEPSAHYQLARALDKAGNPEEARLERQRFAELKKAQPQSGGMATGRVQ